jgi:hypothetical protein
MNLNAPAQARMVREMGEAVAIVAAMIELHDSVPIVRWGECVCLVWQCVLLRAITCLTPQAPVVMAPAALRGDPMIISGACVLVGVLVMRLLLRGLCVCCSQACRRLPTPTRQPTT